MLNIIYRSNMPTLDLHGENRISAKIKLEEFINDNYKLRNLEIAIVHGIGRGIIKEEVYRVLKKNKKVEKFGSDYFNRGCTLARLYDIIDKNGKLCYNTRHKLKGEI